MLISCWAVLLPGQAPGVLERVSEVKTTPSLILGSVPTKRQGLTVHKQRRCSEIQPVNKRQKVDIDKKQRIHERYSKNKMIQNY